MSEPIPIRQSSSSTAEIYFLKRNPFTSGAWSRVSPKATFEGQSSTELDGLFGGRTSRVNVGRSPEADDAVQADEGSWKGSGFATSLVASLGILDPATAAAPIPASGLIAFVREGPESGIYTMTPPGSDLIRLTDGHDYRPRWSPDGTKIAFQRFEGSARSYIYVMDADGGNLERLSTRTGFQPAWSPDGTRIVFEVGSEPRRRSS